MSKITSRAFGGHDDFMAVRQFLIDSYPGYDHLFNWGIDRWDVMRYTANAACELTGDRPWERYVRVWEDAERIVGVVHPEDGGDLHIEVGADHRYLEAEMYEWGEANPSPARGEASPLSTYAKSFDHCWRSEGGVGLVPPASPGADHWRRRFRMALSPPATPYGLWTWRKIPNSEPQ